MASQYFRHVLTLPHASSLHGGMLFGALGKHFATAEAMEPALHWYTSMLDVERGIASPPLLGPGTLLRHGYLIGAYIR